MNRFIKSAFHRYLSSRRFRPIVQKALAPFGRDLKPDKWIFIVGCYNSGTTLLAKILCEHPSIGGLPDEGIAFTDVLPYPEQFGWTRMWYRCIDKVRLHPNQLSEKMVLRIKKQWSFWYPKGKEALLEKSVVNTVRMPFLQAHFQPAYFIAIVRNGYAVAEGIRRRGKPGRWKNPEYKDRYPIELCAMQWQASDDIIRQDQHLLTRFKQIYYEDLVERPSVVLADLFQFVGLEPQSVTIMNKRWKIQERNEGIRNMNEQSFRALSKHDIEVIEHIAKKGLERHGYHRPERHAQ